MFVSGKLLRPIATQRVLMRGGDKRDRTADLLTASQALSQLSYTPMVFNLSKGDEICQCNLSLRDNEMDTTLMPASNMH